MFVCFFLFFFNIKRELAKGKKIKSKKKKKKKKKTRLSPDPVKKIEGGIKNGGQFNLV